MASQIEEYLKIPKSIICNWTSKKLLDTIKPILPISFEGIVQMEQWEMGWNLLTGANFLQEK